MIEFIVLAAKGGELIDFDYARFSTREALCGLLIFPMADR